MMMITLSITCVVIWSLLGQKDAHMRSSSVPFTAAVLLQYHSNRRSTLEMILDQDQYKSDLRSKITAHLLTGFTCMLKFLFYFLSYFLSQYGSFLVIVLRILCSPNIFRVALCFRINVWNWIHTKLACNCGTENFTKLVHINPIIKIKCLVFLDTVYSAYIRSKQNVWPSIVGVVAATRCRLYVPDTVRISNTMGTLTVAVTLISV